MKGAAKNFLNVAYPAVVGTVHSYASLDAALSLRGGKCDWLELRVDNFFPSTQKLLAAAPALPAPRIVTVRHPSQGGASEAISAAERRALYGQFMEVAGAIDIELWQLRGMEDLLREARKAGINIILSHHDFQRTPPLTKLRELAARARDAGADLFKLAAVAATARELAILIEFLASENQPLAVMGMGPYGKISRLALAQAGSRLTYACFGRANASGQWPVEVLRERLAELGLGRKARKRPGLGAPEC